MIRDVEAGGAALIGCKFRFDINGFDYFTVETFEAPDAKFEVAEIDAGGQSVTVKQAGGEKIGEFTTEHIVFAKDPIILKLEAWRSDVQTRDPSKYYKDALFTIMGPNDDPALRADIEDMWPSEPLKVSKLDAKNKKDLVKVTVKWQCNYFTWRR